MRSRQVASTVVESSSSLTCFGTQRQQCCISLFWMEDTEGTEQRIAVVAQLLRILVLVVPLLCCGLFAFDSVVIVVRSLCESFCSIWGFIPITSGESFGRVGIRQHNSHKKKWRRGWCARARNRSDSASNQLPRMCRCSHGSVVISQMPMKLSCGGRGRMSKCCCSRPVLRSTCWACCVCFQWISWRDQLHHIGNVFGLQSAFVKFLVSRSLPYMLFSLRWHMYDFICAASIFAELLFIFIVHCCCFTSFATMNTVTME